MDRKSVVTHGVAVVIGVLLALLCASGSHEGRYVPVDGTSNRILDMRTGRMYIKAIIQGQNKWIVDVNRVGR